MPQERTHSVDVGELDWAPHPKFPGVHVKFAHGDMSAGAFTQMLVQVEPDGEILPHAHPDHDECFVILHGKGNALMEGAHHVVGPQTSVFAPKGREHGMVNVGDEPLLLLANFIPA